VITLEVLPKTVDRICGWGHNRNDEHPCGQAARYLFNGRPYCRKHTLRLVDLMSIQADAPYRGKK
jgi:hypothetical protein